MCARRHTLQFSVTARLNRLTIILASEQASAKTVLREEFPPCRNPAIRPLLTAQLMRKRKFCLYILAKKHLSTSRISSRRNPHKGSHVHTSPNQRRPTRNGKQTNKAPMQHLEDRNEKGTKTNLAVHIRLQRIKPRWPHPQPREREAS